MIPRFMQEFFQEYKKYWKTRDDIPKAIFVIHGLPCSLSLIT